MKKRQRKTQHLRIRRKGGATSMPVRGRVRSTQPTYTAPPDSVGWA